MQVACIAFSPGIDPSVLLNFAEASLRFSPQIAIRQPCFILIEIEKCRWLYSEASFIARVQVLLKRFKEPAKITLARDIPSALARARFHHLRTVDELPVEVLDCFGDPFGTDLEGMKSISKMIESLKRLGIQTVGQFRVLPASALPSRFGKIGLLCRQRMEEGDRIPWPYWQPIEGFVEKMELLPSEFCSEIEPLLFKSKEVLDRLWSRLRGRGLRAEKIRFSIELEKSSLIQNSTRNWSFDLIIPQGTSLGFLPILKERLYWDLSQNPIESEVTSITIEILSYVVSQGGQRHFFHSREEVEEAMGSLFGQLEEYLGKDRVFWVKTTEERFPENSWVKTRRKNEIQVNLKDQIPLRPTRIFRSPIAVSLIQDRVLLKGKSFKVLKWSCVERISLGWLDEEISARNYYRLDLEGGYSLWIFSDPHSHFFAHGYFE